MFSGFDLQIVRNLPLLKHHGRVLTIFFVHLRVVLFGGRLLEGGALVCECVCVFVVILFFVLLSLLFCCFWFVADSCVSIVFVWLWFIVLLFI